MFKNGLQIYTFCFKMKPDFNFNFLQLHEVKIKAFMSEILRGYSEQPLRFILTFFQYI